MSLPLEGVRVIELGIMIAVPAATHVLASYGAEVIKVEDRETGDQLRFYGSNKNGMSAWFANANHGKRSLAVDLKIAEGSDILWRLIDTADVFVEGFRDGVVDTLGFGYAAVAQRKPDIVYCSSSGYGKSGPYAGQPVYDPLIQAVSGWAGIQNPDGEPVFIKNMIADKIAASANVQAIMAALIRRHRCGEGAHIENSMLESNVHFIWSDGMMHCSLLDEDANHLPNLLSGYRVYACGEGHVAIATGNDAQWLAFCEALERADLAADKRFATASARGENLQQLFEAIEQTTLRFERDVVLERLRAVGVPVAPVNRPSEVAGDPQVSATGAIEECAHPVAGLLLRPRSPANRMGEAIDLSPAPTLGEHTDDILTELGFDSEQLAQHRSSGVIR
jgi:crotonobetainyl-CoA:carnitine CoA-transferase CaiB-like acyl-CoA transferase